MPKDSVKNKQYRKILLFMNIQSFCVIQLLLCFVDLKRSDDLER